jgi:AbrB family looped-hinge helix DNA binding protein
MYLRDILIFKYIHCITEVNVKVQMPIPFKVKVVKIGNSLRMTIPKQITDYLKIVEGDTLEITVTDSVMTVRKKIE